MRGAGLLLAAVAVLGGLVAAGRWEHDRAIEREQRGMAAVVSAVGPRLDRRRFTGVRPDTELTCLVFRERGNPSALELCLTTHARVAEAVDRRTGEPSIWTLRHDPGRASLRVDPGAVRSLVAADARRRAQAGS